MTAPAAAPVARLRDVGLRYGKVCALEAVTPDIPAGCMVGLIGPDGVGKSSLLSLVAGARALQKNASAILFIDEIDTIPARGTGKWNDDWWTSITNTLLECLDGFERREGVVVIAACNDPSRLDPALVRSGRLDRHIQIPLPDVPGLIGIFRTHLAGDLQGIDLRAAAFSASGHAGADVERWVHDARRKARVAGRPLTPQDMLDAVRQGGPSGRPRSAGGSPTTRRATQSPCWRSGLANPRRCRSAAALPKASPANALDHARPSGEAPDRLLGWARMRTTRLKNYRDVTVSRPPRCAISGWMSRQRWPISGAQWSFENQNYPVHD